MNMLAELGYAKTVSDRDFDRLFSSKYLFEMATVIPARIARIDDKVGSLRPGLFADVFLLRGDASKPYDALVGAKPADVTLTLIGGVPIYGTSEHLRSLGVTGAENVTVCGETRAAALSLASVTARLQKALAGESLQLGPLAECRK